MNLKAGEHNFHYKVEPEFFSHFENSLVDSGEADVDVLLYKQDDRLFTLDISIQSKLELICDRCISPFTYSSSTGNKFILKIVNSLNNVASEDDVLYASVDDDHINIASSLYELICLQLPMKKSCEMGGSECDKNMIEQISKLSNNKPVNEADPRWDSLRNLISN